MLLNELNKKEAIAFVSLVENLLEYKSPVKPPLLK